jgi:transposase-like protein
MGRWYPERKARLIAAIEADKMSEETAMQAHNISPEELASWRRLYGEFKALGLRTTYLQPVFWTSPALGVFDT